MRMKLNKITIFIIFSLSLFVQIIIISYNFFTGYISVSSFGNYLFRVLIGTSFSFIFSLALIYLDIKLINILDRKFPIPSKLIPRIPVELLFIILIGILIGNFATIIVHILAPYPENLQKVIINNSLITAVINLIVVSVIEAIVWFRRTQKTKLSLEKLERENTQIKFEILKSQINPHFLFNSLNVLSSLINKDIKKAQQFIDEFSSIYRYILDVIEKPVVELRDEINFVKSYLYLQSIRFENSTIIDIKIGSSKLDFFVPPLSIQTLLENAFKHNKASTDNPLKIKIYDEENFLIVKNNLQPKINNNMAKGIGLNNLRKRYELLGANTPLFVYTNEEYIAKIPLIFNGI